MRRLFVPVPAFVLVAAYGACTDYQENPASPPLEAGVDGTDLPADGGGVSDAPVEAGPTGFCASRRDAGVLWCEDFDDLTSLESLVPVFTDPAIEPKLARKTFASEPQSVSFMLPPNTQAGQGTVVQRAFAIEREARLDVAWHWTAAPVTAGLTLQSITIQRGAINAAFLYTCAADLDAAAPCVASISTCTPACTTHPMQGITFGAWKRVALQARFGANGHVRFEQEGVALLDLDVPTAPVDPNEPTSATIGLYVAQASTTQPIETLFDDLVFELR